MKNNLTIKDLAKILNISPSTVSRALKDHPAISDETKYAVRRLAQKLNYQPNTFAKSLKTQRSDTIGVIIPEIAHYYFSPVFSGIEDVAYSSKFTVIICPSNEKYEREVANINTLLAHRVDGILVSISKETKNFEHLKNLMDFGIPLVFFDRIVEEIKADQVIIDNYEAAYQVTKHLINTGKKKIAHLSGPKNLLFSKYRKAGFYKAIEDSGNTVDDRMVNEAYSFSKAYEVTSRMLNNNIIPDGIFANNDVAALGAMQAVRENGLKIPNQVAIAGFDNGWFSKTTTPPLTTVDQLGYTMGAEACRQLIKRIKYKIRFEPTKKILNANLITRGSTVLE